VVVGTGSRLCDGANISQVIDGEFAFWWTTWKFRTIMPLTKIQISTRLLVAWRAWSSVEECTVHNPHSTSDGRMGLTFKSQQRIRTARSLARMERTVCSITTPSSQSLELVLLLRLPASQNQCVVVWSVV